MENKAKYFWVGIFVFGIFFASLFVLIWLNGFSSKQNFTYYQIFIKESVSGLGLKAPVRLLGVEIGSVEDLSLYKADNGDTLVKILIKVKEGTPIYTATIASLGLEGITGLKYVELTNDEQKPKEPLVSSNSQPPTIKAKESLFASIGKQSDRIFDLIDFTNESMRQLFSQQNLNNISNCLKTLNAAISNINSMAKRVEQASVAVARFAEDSVNTLKDYDKVSFLLANNLSALQELLVTITEFAKQLEHSPSDIFFKGTVTKPAPGE